MSDPKQPIGCLGLLVVALFLGTFAFVFYRVTSMDIWGAPEMTHQPQRLPKHFERTDTADGPDFTTMDQQLLLAQEKGQKVTQIRLEGTPAAIDGSWTVKEVGYDVVVFEGSSGLMTVRMESIVSIQVSPVELKKPQATAPEPQVEK